MLGRRALRLLNGEGVESVEFLYDEAITDLILTVSQFCDILSHFEAETAEEQAMLDKKGAGFVTIGDIEEMKIPELREPEVPSTELKRYRKGRVR